MLGEVCAIRGKQRKRESLDPPGDPFWAFEIRTGFITKSKTHPLPPTHTHISLSLLSPLPSTHTLYSIIMMHAGVDPMKKRRIAVLGSRSVGEPISSIQAWTAHPSLDHPSLTLCPPGKSSLVVQYVENNFVESYYPTIENTFTKNIKYNGVEYECDIIDTAGQVRPPFRLPANPRVRLTRNHRTSSQY